MDFELLCLFGAIVVMAMCVKCMSSRSCLGRFSRFAIPTLMYIS